MAKTVLAIDDTVKILNIIKFFLEGDGYLVKTSPDPFLGVRIACEGGIDLILLDIMMPGMDGYQVYKILKEDERTRDIPVIMLTAKAVIMNTPKNFFYGLYGFLSKPFAKKDLLTMVGNILHMTDEEKGTRCVEMTDVPGGPPRPAPSSDDEEDKDSTRIIRHPGGIE